MFAKTAGLQAALDSKQGIVTNGSLTMAKTAGLQAALDAKQAVVTDGSLTIAKTTGLQAALDAKQTTIVNNSLQIRHVSGLQAALNNAGGNTSGLLPNVGPATFTGNLSVTGAFYADPWRLVRRC